MRLERFPIIGVEPVGGQAEELAGVGESAFIDVNRRYNLDEPLFDVGREKFPTPGFSVSAGSNQNRFIGHDSFLMWAGLPTRTPLHRDVGGSPDPHTATP
jgi:hypothetical protein